MKKIALPSSLGLWALLLLAPLPILYFLIHYAMTIDNIQKIDEKLDTLLTKKQQSDAVQKRQHSVLSSLVQSDPFYIDKHLETLLFLESEIKKMEALFSDTMVDESAKKRLHFLKEGPNRLLFAEDKIRTKNKVREVMERQQHQVEINEEDLKKLLCLIEGVTIWPYGPKEGRPQLVIQDFQLLKKKQDSQDHVFSVHLNIIKRENSESKESDHE